MATAFSSKFFGYSAQLKLFATDVSVLESVGQVWDRIHPDSADQGFEVVSDKTGNTTTWFVDRVDVREGEIQGWNLKPTLSTISKLPQLRGVRMLVVNT